MKKFITITLFHLTFNLGAFSQANFYAFDDGGVRDKIDQLKKELPGLKDAARTDCLNKLGEAYLTFNLDTANVYATLALKDAEEISYIKGEENSYRNLGRIELWRPDLASAEIYLSKSLELFIKTKDEFPLAQDSALMPGFANAAFSIYLDTICEVCTLS